MDPDFDEFLHVPARLSVIARQDPADRVEFGFVRDAVGTSDSALSKQVAALADAGSGPPWTDDAASRASGRRLS
ncbi:hypothetical protein [Streptomyces virginiae]|uniref:hypothetical protein n=1 Tax=Streptomyces virginiae TaxID=1961 RepID=UPI002250FC47|nr:hypothetical protein [Streptomyces virginiae]MCX5174781.1 transcriptional regulator [Streptomyces virginiae]